MKNPNDWKTVAGLYYPTRFAERLKETFDETLPNELDDVLNNMSTIRNRLNGDFAEKVNELNKITGILASKKHTAKELSEKRWRKIATWSLFAFLFMTFYLELVT